MERVPGEQCAEPGTRPNKVLDIQTRRLDAESLSPDPPYFADADRMKSGLGGEHMDSNHRLIYTWACASPQKWRAPAAVTASGFHLKTVSSESPH